MRSLRALAWLVLAAAAPAADALVYRDQVGDIDFHHRLVGLPQRAATFFHRPRRDDKASLLYTLSDVGVLGALNPSSGELVWRHLLVGDDDDDNADADADADADAAGDSGPAGHVEAVEGEGWLAAGLGGAVHAWNALSGRNVWWASFAGEVADVAVAGAGAGAAAEKEQTATAAAAARSDVLALFREDGHLVLRRLAGHDGHVVWEHRAAHAGNAGTAGGGLAKLTVSAATVYAVRTAAGSGSLTVLAVDAHTGRRVEEHSLASDVHAAAQVLFVGGGIVAWTDGGRAATKVRVSVLGGGAAKHSKHELALPAGTESVLVHALRGRAASFLVHTRTAGRAAHRAQVYHVDAAKGTVQKAYDLPQAPGAGAFAVTAAAGDDAASVYFTRVTDDEMVLVGSASHGILGRWPVAQPVALHASGGAAAEVVVRAGNAGSRSDSGYALRTAVLTADEDWVLLRSNGQRAWSRPEGLTGSVAAVLVDRPESEQLARALEQEEAQSPLAAYRHRVERHLDDLEHLPAYLQALPGKLLRSVLGGGSGGGGADGAATAAAADAFGFHKLAVLATRRGRLYGLDAASPGTVLWNTRAVDVGPAAPWAVRAIYVDEASGVATVVGATAGQSVDVAVATGAVTASSIQDSVGDGGVALAGAVRVHGAAAGPWLLPVPADGQFPALAADRCPAESLVVRDHASAAGGLRGVRFVVADGACVPETTWTFAPPAPFRVVDVATRPAHDPVASIGRVLGDRTVLYKYLNPNLAVVAAVADETRELMTFLLDTVSGELLASAVYGGVDGRKPVECLLFENTFLCTFFADYTVAGGGSGSSGSSAPAQAIKGYHLAVSDLYESTVPNDRGALGASAPNVSAVAPLRVVARGGGGGDDRDDRDPTRLLRPAVVSATWVVGSRLTSLAVTQTRQGITVRQVLAYVPRVHGIVGFARVAAVLDARRPVGRAATPQEAEEGLVPYAPQLEIDPRLVLTHERDVLGVARLVTAATHVESTSLVLAVGRVDVFGTRAAPSLAFDLLDKGFGKRSMLATVAALAAGVFVLRPLVARKQINQRWQALL